MHKWCLEDLCPATGGQETDVWAQLENPRLSTPDFVEDRPRGGPVGVLNRLDQAERDALFDLVAERIRADIATELREQKQLQDTLQQQIINQLISGLEQRIDVELGKIAEGAADLAVAISERILRASAPVDPEYLLRGIAEIAAGARRGLAFTVLAHPDDLDLLRVHQERLARLNVTDLRPDPRLSRGSCLVQSEGREWDLTLDGQLAAVADLVRGTLAAGAGPDAPAPDAGPVPDPRPATTTDETHDTALV